MPTAPSISTQAQNAACDAAVDLTDVGSQNGRLRIYGGTMPASANAALGAAVLLADLVMAKPAFGSSVAGTATAAAITSDTSADATGTATFFRVGAWDGVTFTTVMQGSVGTSASDLILVSTSIVAGAPVSVTALSYSQAGS